MFSMLFPRAIVCFSIVYSGRPAQYQLRRFKNS
jgi:hypothetical protein